MTLFTKTIPGDVGSAYLDEVTSQLNRSVGKLTVQANRMALTNAAGAPANIYQDTAQVGTYLGTSTRICLGYFAEDTYVSNVLIGFNPAPLAAFTHATDNVSLVVGMSPAGVGGTTVASCTDFDPAAPPGANLDIDGVWVPWDSIEEAAGVVTGGSKFVIPAGNALTLVFTLDVTSGARTREGSVYNVSVEYSIFKDSVSVSTDFNAVQRNWHLVPR